MSNHYNRTVQLCSGVGCGRKHDCVFYLALVEATENGEDPSFVANKCESTGEDVYVEVHIKEPPTSPTNTKAICSGVAVKAIAQALRAPIPTIYNLKNAMLWHDYNESGKGVARGAWQPPTREAKQLICWCDFNDFPLAKICERWQWLLLDVRKWLATIKPFEYATYITELKS